MAKHYNKIDTGNTLGGKAHGLKILTELGYKVPEYFVISFDDDIYSSEMNTKINEFVQKFKRVAVRSSANIEDGENASFAGQFSSYLDVSINQVLDRIDDVRKSAKNEHIKNYCKAMGISSDDIKMNVIVQKFDEPKSGGVWMGKGLSGGRLEWVKGRGDIVVNGEATPFYEIYGDKGQLLDKNAEHILADQSRKSVAEYCKNIQLKLGYDVDIEFCITQDGIQWLQLRKVTRETSDSINSVEILNDAIITGEVASPYIAQGMAYRLDQEGGNGWGVGKILVARATSPNDMMYIMTSQGVVTKMGGMLSHAAVVCRELGKACVVGVDIDKISHGRHILVDGKLGKVHLL